MNLPLFLLWLRRAMPPALGVVLLAAAVIALRSGAPPKSALLEAEDPAQLARGLFRHDYWFLLCAVLLPVQVLTAGRWARRLREGEASWLLPRALPGRGIVATTWLALLAGGVAWLVAIGAVGELGAGGSAASQRVLGEWRLRDDRARSADHRLRWEAELGALPEGSRGRLHLGLLGDFGNVDALRLSVERDGDEPRVTEGSAKPSRRMRIDVALPPGSGPLRFELEVVGETEPVLLDGLRFELSTPAPERAGVAALLLHLSLVLAAWLALALGLGAWLSAPTAVFGLAVIWSVVWLEGVGGALLPGAALPEVFAALGEGRVPPPLPAGVGLGAAALVTLGLLLAGAGMRWGRRSA